MNEKMTDYRIVQTMLRFGGSFAKALAVACERADDDNLARIKRAFPELWSEYAEMARLSAIRATSATD